VPKIPALMLATAALAIGLGACGGSSSSSSSSSSSPASSSATAPATSTASAATGASGALALSADPSGQLKFSKTTLSAKAGTVTITFANPAPEGHNLTVAGSSGSVVGATPTFNGGSKTLTLHLKPGTYTFYCSVPGHRAGGMQGTLTVQ
jgi:plastocyanin